MSSAVWSMFYFKRSSSVRSGCVYVYALLWPWQETRPADATEADQLRGHLGETSLGVGVHTASEPFTTQRQRMGQPAC